MTAPILCQSEQDFRRRVRDLEACIHEHLSSMSGVYALLNDLNDDNARLRSALRTLARLQSPRVSRAVLEVLNDA